MRSLLRYLVTKGVVLAGIEGAVPRVRNLAALIFTEAHLPEPKLSGVLKICNQATPPGVAKAGHCNPALSPGATRG